MAQRQSGIGLQVRAVLFYLGLVIGLLVWGVTGLPVAALLPPKPRFTVVTRFNVFVLWWLRICCGLRYEVEGLDNVPRERAVVLLSNHQSEWETFYLQTLLSPLCSVLKRELLKIPVFGWGLSLLRPIALDRSKRSNAMKQVLQQGKTRLQEGFSVLLFPEGTRVPPEKKGRFNKGGAALAVAAGAPVLPLVHNAGEFWRAHQFAKQPGVIKVVIGPLIEVEGLSVQEVHERSVGWMEQQLERISTVKRESHKPQQVSDEQNAAL